LVNQSEITPLGFLEHFLKNTTQIFNCFIISQLQ
tara:strand:- start:92314 stop:92415 length:102 start_codon:yes stop_codon:yes gene_type:complete